MSDETVFNTISEDTKKLVVLLHSFGNKTVSFDGIVNVIRGQITDHAPGIAEDWGDADILIPALPASLVSFATMEGITKDVLEKIDDVWRDKGGYHEIIFVGHSLGSLIARYVYVLACGNRDGAPPLEPRQAGSHRQAVQSERSTAKPWADKITRIVLMAGMNRGWRLSHHLSLKTALYWTPGVWAIHFLNLFGLNPLIAQIRKGAPFLTNLRLQWIRMRQWKRYDNSLPGGALTIQLLGSIDDMVAPDDNIDLVSGRDFVYLEVPYTSHGDVIDMGHERTGAEMVPDWMEGEPPTKGAARRAVLAKALSLPIDQEHRAGVTPTDEEPFEPDTSVTDVVFVIHGIRDRGYWTHKLARRVVQIARERELKARIQTETSSYGYFSIAEFLQPAGRRTKVEWLMDQYAEAVARYPAAKFSYIGHSNGTYLLAKALQSYPLCRFDNVIFAGSVVQRGFDWSARTGQIKRLLNIRATADWVVAFFPKAFQDLSLQDIGSAGHDGFRRPDQSIVVDQPLYRGGHGAALVEQNWDKMASFVLSGDPPEVPRSVSADNLSVWQRRTMNIIATIGEVAPMVWVMMLVIACLGGWAIWSISIAEWARTVLILGYTWLLIKLAYTV